MLADDVDELSRSLFELHLILVGQLVVHGRLVLVAGGHVSLRTAAHKRLCNVPILDQLTEQTALGGEQRRHRGVHVLPELDHLGCIQLGRLGGGVGACWDSTEVFLH